MRSPNIYTLSFLLILGSCNIKTVVNDIPLLEGTWVIEKDIKRNIINKETGTYTYPNLKTRYTLKKGKFNGPFQIIGEKNDTLFYCTYKDNLPVGEYILKEPDSNDKIFHRRSIPVKPKLEYGYGCGFFNQNHKKDGVWSEGGTIIMYNNGEIVSSNIFYKK